MENIPKANRSHFDLSWKPGGVDYKNNTEHRNYLKALGDDFKRKVNIYNYIYYIHSKHKYTWRRVFNVQCAFMHCLISICD